MAESLVGIDCLKQIEDLARMPEQHRGALALLWLTLDEIDAALQFSKRAKEVRQRDQVKHWTTAKPDDLK